MIEQSIYFALGCIVTALLALCFAPLFWSRALRLTRRRLQLQVPLSMQEILAERDQLRAAFAVERLRVEQELARVEATKAKDMAEIGRRSMEVVAMTAELTDLRRLERAQQGEIDMLLREQAETGAESSSLKIALDDAHGLVARLKRRSEEADDERRRHQNDAEMHRATVASLETRAMGLEMQLLDAKRAASPDAHGGLKSKLESAMAQASRHEAASLSLRRELDEAKARLRALEDEALDREKAQHLERSMRLERQRIAGRAAPDATLPADAPADSGAEQVMSNNPVDEDSGLRDSIHALGLAVATMAREARKASSEEPSTAPVGRAPSRAEVP